MAEKTNSELNTQALEIKNETVQSANSATRVGQLFEDISDSLANKSEVNAIYETGRTLTNNIVFDKYSINYAPAYGGTWALTSSGVGNISADSYASVVIEQPTSVTIDSEWNSQGGSQPTPDITKRIEILLHKDSEGNVFYIISNNEIQGQDITAPTVNSATIQDAAPDELIVVFSEAVNVTNTTGLSFSDDLMATTIDSVASGSGTTTVTFNLGGTAPQAGDVANFVYGASNTIVDLSGNSLVAGQTSVTNNVGDVTAPTVSSATVDAAGTSLTVVFSEAVTGTNTGLSFTGTLAGSIGSLSSGSGTDTLVFPITGGPVLQSQSGNFAYTSSDIDDLSGNSLIDGSTAVTNNSTQSVFTDTYSWRGVGSDGSRPTWSGTASWFTGDTSAAFWIKQGNFDRTISGFNLMSFNTSSYSRFRLNSGGSLVVQIFTDASNHKSWAFSNADNILDGQWHLIGFSYDYATETVKGYVDGVEFDGITPAETGTFDKTSILSNDTPLFNWSGTQQNLMGDFAIWEEIRSAQDMIDLYNSGDTIDMSTIGTPDMYVNFEEGTGDWIDQMGNYTVATSAANGEYTTDTPTSPEFWNDTSRLEEQQHRSESDTNITWSTIDDFSCGGWFKGVNFVNPTSSWTVFAGDGGAESAFRIVQPNNDSTILITMWSSLGNSYTWSVGTVEAAPWVSAMSDGNWHSWASHVDFINKTVSLWLDGTEIVTPAGTENGTFVSGDQPAATFSFRGSNATGGDLIDNCWAWENGVVTEANAIAIHNSGVPRDVREILPDVTTYLTFEGDLYVDLTGNYTFTEVAAGGSYSSDTA